jgi:hypothetical protein
VNSSVVSDGGSLSGTWTELNRNVSGNVSGRVSANQISARVDGPGFSAGMAIVAHGSRQSVTIQAPGQQIRDVSLSLTKSA